MSIRGAVVALLVLVGGAGACSDSGDAPPPAAALRFDVVELPSAAGATARVAALAHSGETWWAAGSTIDGDGARRPALWRSADATGWAEVTTAPVSFYGERSELYSVAAGPAGVVAVGAASGGAHGNPRTATWVLDGDVLREVAAPFEQYGGPRAISVRAVAAGPAGFAIVGTRRAANDRTGGVAWVSPDGNAFTLVDDDPALQSTSDELAHPAAVVGSPTGYVAVGDVRYSGRRTLDADGIVWTSIDGLAWSRVAVGFDDLEVPGSITLTALTSASVGPIAAGVATARDGADVIVLGSQEGAGWRGLRVPGWGDGPVVTGLAASGSVVVVAGRRGEVPALAMGAGESWQVVDLPGGAPTGPHVDVDVVAASGVAVVAAADDRSSGIWRSTLP